MYINLQFFCSNPSYINPEQRHAAKQYGWLHLNNNELVIVMQHETYCAINDPIGFHITKTEADEHMTTSYWHSDS